MRLTRLAQLNAATLAAASFTTSARADGVCNCIGRYFGWGWSEGYHAYDNCPRYCPMMVAPCAPALLMMDGAARVAATPTEKSRLVSFITSSQ